MQHLENTDQGWEEPPVTVKDGQILFILVVFCFVVTPIDHVFFM